MIFDSADVERLRLQFKDVPDYDIPHILIMDRWDSLTDERLLLEEIIKDVSQEKQKEWLGRLYDQDVEQFISAWFEMVLYHWLLPAGDVQVEPEILGNKPDFLVKAGDQQIVIEAKAFPVSHDERDQQKWRNAFISAIQSIRKPFLIEAKRARLVAMPDSGHIVQAVSDWLVSNPDTQYVYEDRSGNIVVLESQHIPHYETAQIGWSGGAQWLNPDILKTRLREKAKANMKIRKAGYPYIIALFIEDDLYSVEEVVDAWFGNETFVIDTNTNQVVEMKRDSRGLHHYRKEISHRTVSGTLVFKAQGGGNFRGRRLQGWLIENPFANVKVDASIFPVEASYLVTGQNPTGYFMGWVENKE